VTYSTTGSSYDTLTVASRPQSIQSGRYFLAEVQNPDREQPGWSYDAATGLLKIQHMRPEREIVITLE
jgi:hypothetical protein